MKSSLHIDLKEAARMLKKSSRQVMRYVETGKLKATGGGRGVPFSFKKADVEAFRRRNSAIADAYLLARIAYAFEVKHKPPAKIDLMAKIIKETLRDRNEHDLIDSYFKNFPLKWLNIGFGTLWRLRKAGDEYAIGKYIGNCLPAVENVPKELKNWAEEMEQKLTPSQMDFLAALFIVRQHPVLRYKSGEGNVLGKALVTLKKTQPFLFTGWQDFRKFTEAEMELAWGKIQEFVRKDMPSDITPKQRRTLFDGQHRLFMNSECRWDAWEIFQRYHPYDSLDATLLAACQQGDADGILSYIDTDNKDGLGPNRTALYPELQDMVSAFIKTSLQQKKRDKRQGEAKISAARVADVLGIDRFQASRLWTRERGRQGICQKLGRSGILKLAEMLQFHLSELPKSWKGKDEIGECLSCGNETARLIDEAERCPHCGTDVVDAFCMNCPECGKSLIGADVVQD